MCDAGRMSGHSTRTTHAHTAYKRAQPTGSLTAGLGIISTHCYKARGKHTERTHTDADVATVKEDKCISQKDRSFSAISFSSHKSTSSHPGPSWVRLPVLQCHPLILLS